MGEEALEKGRLRIRKREKEKLEKGEGRITKGWKKGWKKRKQNEKREED